MCMKLRAKTTFSHPGTARYAAGISAGTSLALDPLQRSSLECLVLACVLCVLMCSCAWSAGEDGHAHGR